ncbi:related to multidrug resistance protein [Cephalotrichum gorgonifer]|uniref:Related to multidrug resistance protein n=1 Tax=Cephalotrichum gorgonifer TaxID=2041049 RepID=A0AAE8N0U7_9PEZI|nr:related to multidrug resistance protein [Cephalotrichum gorgonifer]
MASMPEGKSGRQHPAAPKVAPPMASLNAPESSPLLAGRVPERRKTSRGDARDVYESLCDWDPDNPRDWSPSFKWGIVALLAATGFVVTFTCMAVVPVVNLVVGDLESDGIPDGFAAVLPITIWELGEAVGPLLIAPLSELYGRYPLMNAANLLFITGAALSALSPSMPVFIASRALTGMAVASNVLGPAIVGDIFVPEQRGKATSLIGFAPLFGGTISPAISGIITEAFGWRTIMWVCVVLASACQFVLFTYFRETYSVVLLRRKASRIARADRESGYGAISEGADADVGESVVEKPSAGMLASITRPATVLSSSGVLVAVCIFGSSVFSYFYILSTTLPGILEGRYGMSPSETGAVFLVNGIGSVLAIGVCRVWLDRIYITLRDANDGVGLPEHRLPIAIAAAFILPPALLLYGWGAQYTLPLPFLILSLIVIRMCIVMGTLPLIAYVVDASGVYSASAFTGVIVTRGLAGAFFPIGTAELVKDAGYGWGFTVLGGYE